MSNSFSSETKNDLCGVYLKKVCCKKAFLCGALLGCGKISAAEAALYTEHERFAQLFCKIFRNVFHISLTPAIHEEIVIPHDAVPAVLAAFGYEPNEDPLGRIALPFACEYDKGAFLRGVFLACGTVTMPDASYHLELMPQHASFRELLREFLTENGLEPKVGKRASRKEDSLYYKDSEAMEDFLNFIGAQKSAFQLMNVKIKRDLRNHANRVANCDMANIDKTITAATKQMDAILKIMQESREDELSPQLRQTFDLRAAYPDANLSELAAMHSPPISKSGVSHRLSKLIAFAACGDADAEQENEQE